MEMQIEMATSWASSVRRGDHNGQRQGAQMHSSWPFGWLAARPVPLAETLTAICAAAQPV